MQQQVSFLALASVLVGCSPLDGGGSAGTQGEDAPPDGHHGESALPDPFTIDGVYEGTQAWDFSQIAVVGEGTGDLAAEEMISAVVDLSGLPSFLTGEAKDLLSDLLADRIAAAVDEQLSGQSSLTLLQDVLGMVTLESRFVLEEGADGEVSGSEELISLTFSFDGRLITVPMGALASTVGYDTLTSDLVAGLADDGSTLTVEDHPYFLRAETILAIAGVEVLGFDTLHDGLMSVIDCGDLVSELTNGTGELSFSVSTYEVTVEYQQLLGVCDRARLEIVDTVLGTFQRELGVEVGGALAVVQNVGAAASLKSLDYGGRITLLPAPLRPTFPIFLSASKIE